MKPKNLKPPTGQKLADELASMVDIRKSRLTGRWYQGAALLSCKSWQPHLSYDQCRIVEDWILENGLWYECKSSLRNLFPEIYQTDCLRSTPLQRCQAAWLAWKENGAHVEKPESAKGGANEIPVWT